MYSRIAFIKTGWSDTYKGGAVFGRHNYIAEYKDAHERFNFLLGPKRKFFAYVPPVGNQQCSPQPENRDGWLLVFVAAELGKGPLKVVGWYKNAKFEKEYKPRPEYNDKINFKTDINGDKYFYCVSSNEAVLIPSTQRSVQISGQHFRRSPIVYVRGNNYNERWRVKMAKLAETIIRGEKPETRDSGMPTVVFPDAEHRKKVEKVSVNTATKYLENKGYTVENREKMNCGYDLLAIRNRTPKELHIEVKGTSTSIPYFYITENERNYMRNPKWRLALITNALNKKNIKILDFISVKSKFDDAPLAWYFYPKEVRN